MKCYLRGATLNDLRVSTFFFSEDFELQSAM